jgi:hypothetical protein
MIGEVVETSASFEARFRATTLPDREAIDYASSGSYRHSGSLEVSLSRRSHAV